MKLLNTRITRSTYTGLAAGLGIGLMASIAYAAIPSSIGVISGCVTTIGLKGQHALTLLDTIQSTVCQDGQTLITWNQTGPKGDAGPQGPAGASGPKGDIGPAGPGGVSGAKGDTGSAGPAGPKGDTGSIGMTGPAGMQGPKGDVGAAGPIGPTGPPGADGLQGLTGPAGPAGQSVIGLPEPAGVSCATGGLKYTDGAGNVQFVCNGAAGPQGVTGPPGLAAPANAVNSSFEPFFLSSGETGLSDSTYTDIGPTTINVPASGNGHLVLIIGQAEVVAASATVFVLQAVADGAVIDGPYHIDVASGRKAEASVSRVISLGAGTHAITLQGRFDQLVQGGVVRHSLSVVDLGPAP